MKSAQYAKYFIRIILAICVMAIIFTIFHIFTPKIDVFSSVGVHWLADKPQEVVHSIPKILWKKFYKLSREPISKMLKI